MAAPTITLLNHTELTDADTNSGWNDLTTPDADIKKEGTASMSGILRADGEQGYYDHGSAPSTGVGKTVRGWIFTNNIAYMDTEAVDPYKLLCYDGSTEEQKAIFGSDTYPGGWFNFIWDMDEFTTLTLANVQRWGVECGHAISAKNVVNTWMDVLRYLDGYSMTGGTSGDKVELSDIAIYDKGTTTLRGYGIIEVVSTVYFCTGDVQFGTGATVHYFEMDGEILVFKDEHVAAGLYSLSGVGSGTDVVIKNSVIKSAGSTDATRFSFDWSEANLASCSIVDTLINRAAACTFKSGQTITGNTFDDCGQITHAGSNMNDCKVKNYEGAVNSSALIYDVNADPSGEMDDMAFTKGTAATHAIEFGTTSPLSMSLNGIDFSGYNAADEEDDSALHIKRTVGTVEIALVGCTGNIFYKSDGATVVLTASKSATFTPIEDGSAFTITKNSDNSVLKDVASTSGGEVVYSYDGALDDTETTVHLIIAGKEPIDFPWTIAEGTIPISQVTDRVYSNP